MYHQVDKLDKVQEYCFGGYGPAVKTDYLVACAAILGCLFWGLEQDAMDNKVTTTAGMFTKETALKSQETLGLARVQKESQTGRQMVRLVVDGRTVHGHIAHERTQHRRCL
jgi:hypothetical protein